MIFLLQELGFDNYWKTKRICLPGSALWNELLHYGMIQKFISHKRVIKMCNRINNKKIPLSVVIPFHEDITSIKAGERSNLERVLLSLCRSLCPANEIICVDDNSNGCFESVVSEYKARYVRISVPQATPHISHRAKARQIGLNLAKNEVVLFLDADILVTEELLRVMNESVKHHGPKAMVFAQRENLMTPCREKELERRNNSGEFALSIMDTYAKWDNNRNEQPIWAQQTSHCFAIHRDFIISAGGWDENFVGWGEEDTELFYRLWRAGGKIIKLNDPKVTVKHIFHPVEHYANYVSFKRNAGYFIAKHPEVSYLRRAFYQHFGILPKKMLGLRS